MRVALATLAVALRLSAADLPPLDYDHSTPLDLKESPVTVRDGIRVSLISYANPSGGRTDGMLVVPPAGIGRTAGIVWAHSSGYFNQLPDAMLMARDGAVSLLVDLSFSTDSAAAARTEMIRSITSLRRAVDILAARPDIDPARIGFVGHSYGAMGSPLNVR